jgi:ABC-type sugar transport system substrate-binding protein
MVFKTLAVAVLAGIVAMTAGTPAVATPEKPRVAFINPGYGDRGFWKDVSDTMHAAAAQFGFEIVEFDSNRKWPEMAENTNRVLEMNPPPDYIVAVNEHQQGARIVIEAEKRGIPLFMLLNDLTPDQKERVGRPGQIKNWIATLTPDNEKAGYQMAVSLIRAEAKTHPQKAKTHMCLLTLAGDRNTPASLDRLKGLDRALGEYPALAEQRRLYADWSFDEAYKRTSLWLRDGCLDAVWAANDDIARGAIRALTERGLKPGKDVMVAGLNWSASGLKLVQNGEMTMTHGGHFLAGAWIMVMINDYAHGVDLQKIGPNFYFPMQAITRGNIEQFQKALGDRNWKKIDFNYFSLASHPDRQGYQFDMDELLSAVSAKH